MLYSASLFFRSFHLHGSNEDPLWEESVVLLRAEDEVQALEAAKEYALLAEVAYNNREGEVVSWKFVQVERIYPVEADLQMQPIDVLDVGVEVFSRYLTHTEAQSLLGAAL